MAVTQTPPETVQAASVAATSTQRAQPTGLAAVVGSGDHKTIGRLYILSSLLLGVGVLVLGLLFGLEAMDPDKWSVFTATNGLQLFTLLRVATLFLLAFPLVIGVALVVVPLQVGAPSIAFPRAAAASFWGWFLGSILVIASYIADGGPFGTSANGVNLWITAMGLVIVSLLIASVSLATTVLALRAPGMTLDRTPLYSWSVAVATIMWIITLPVLVGFIVLMYVDHSHAGTSIGTTSDLYPDIGWLFRNPQIYVVAIPVLGFVADVVASSVNSRTKARWFAQSAITWFGIVSFGAFLAIPTARAVDSVLMVVLSLLAVVPVLAIGALTGDLARGGRLKANPAIAYALSAYIVLLIATIAGALGSLPDVVEAPGEGTAGDSIYFLGVAHAVILAAIIGALGGVTWWASKIGRRQANAKLALMAPAILLVGTIASVVPNLVSGLAGSGNELTPDPTGGMSSMNALALVGLVITGLGLALAAVSLLPLFKRSGDPVPADPWGTGQTLEWMTSSPPSVGNFDNELALVTSPEPLLDSREEK